jgi:asparagine synthase (glutamine-hydrolysing)
MCGIAGIFAYRADAPGVELEELRAIRDAMRRRGPDGSGEWLASDGRVALGHRRLAIIDLSERGQQPMSTPDGSLVVTFNGEIYNYRELRAELEERGFCFRSQSDTEVLLWLWIDRGEAMLAALRGMFAFALWDARQSELVLARDPYGIKPLYYADDGRAVRAASSVKALRAGGRVGRTTDNAGIAGFYLFGSVPEPWTTLRSVRAVPAGSLVRVSARGVQAPRRFFSIAQVYADAGALDPSRRRAADLQGIVRQAVLDSVRHHLVADVPVGAFLSAGVDSEAIVSLAREAGQGELRTVTLALDEFRGTRNDEAPLAEAHATRLGTSHSTRTIGADELRGDLRRIVAAMDQPSIDGMNSWYVSKVAHEVGLKVALSGLGGDELFAGYPSFRQLPRMVPALHTAAKVPGLAHLLRHAWEPFGARHPRLSPKLGGLLMFGGTWPGAYFLRRGLFMPWELRAVMGADAAADGLERLRPFELIEAAMDPDPGTEFSRVACLESSLYMRNQLLRDTDWASMDHSLEVRVPLVDSALLRTLAPHFVANPPRNGKRLLAMSPSVPLPGEVLRRPKSGFSLPMSQWISDARSELDLWRRVPLLARRHCHWSRRLAFSLIHRDEPSA